MLVRIKWHNTCSVLSTVPGSVIMPQHSLAYSCVINWASPRLRITPVFEVGNGWGGCLWTSHFILQASRSLFLFRHLPGDSPHSPGTVCVCVCYSQPLTMDVCPYRMNLCLVYIPSGILRHDIYVTRANEVTCCSSKDKAGLSCYLTPFHIIYWFFFFCYCFCNLFCLLCVISLHIHLSAHLYSTSTYNKSNLFSLSLPLPRKSKPPSSFNWWS